MALDSRTCPAVDASALHDSEWVRKIREYDRKLTAGEITLPLPDHGWIRDFVESHLPALYTEDY